MTMEAANQALLTDHFDRLAQRKTELNVSRRNLSQVQRSYTRPRHAGWQSYS
jgi:hypothetical protein